MDLVNDAKIENPKIVCRILGLDPELLPPYSERPPDLQAKISRWYVHARASSCHSRACGLLAHSRAMSAVLRYARLDVIAHLRRVGCPMVFAAGGNGGAGRGSAKRQKA